MSWERRRGGRRYYYRKRREGKRVISEYIGTGKAAELQAALDDRERRRRAEERQRRRKERVQMEQVDQALDELEAVTTALAQATLIVEGFHTHDRTWRKRQHESRSANPKAQIPISK